MLSLQSIASFSSDALTHLELRSFYPPEDGFVWSTGRWSELRFDFSLPPPRGKLPIEVILDADVYRPEGAEHQNVFMYLNGLRIGSFRVTSRQLLIGIVDISNLRPTSNVLTLDTPDARSPQAFGGDDGRELGAKVYSLQFRPAA